MTSTNQHSAKAEHSMEPAQHIILIGLPGSGKTSLGCALANSLGLPHLDIDEAIAREHAQTIRQIFADSGEARFRAIESEALLQALKQAPQVISTGGGTVLSSTNRTAMQAQGYVIFIDRPVESIEKDINWEQRPLLDEGSAKLYQLNTERRALYLDTAHITIENTGSFAEMVDSLRTVQEAAALTGFAVIGFPIAHSLSPCIHGATLGEQYTALEVKPESLSAFVAASKLSGLRGFNVTAPHKETIMPLLDSIDEEARSAGAVNTVLIHNGKLEGHSTDAEGLQLALKDAGRAFKGSHVLILGAGGVASALATKAQREGAASIRIHARNPEKLAALKKKIPEAQSGGFDAQSLCAAASQSDLLLQCTPLGMQGTHKNFESLDFLSALPAHALVCDLIYKPSQTPLLQEAEKLGLACMNGLAMLLYQAVLAQEYFLNTSLDRTAVFSRMKDCLAAELPEEMEV